MLKKEPFYFLRHGQTDWNKEGIIQGQTDIPLNETGRNQAELTYPYLRDMPVRTICCSPLARAMQTAKIINKVLKCQLVIIDELKECHFGAAEGKQITGETYDEIIRSAESFGGEPFDSFTKRMITGVNQALTHPGPVLIISHGGVFHALKARTRLEHNGDMPNCAPVYLKPSSGAGQDWKMRPVRQTPPI